jgi:hypothetical protein
MGLPVFRLGSDLEVVVLVFLRVTTTSLLELGSD